MNKRVFRLVFFTAVGAFVLSALLVTGIVYPAMENAQRARLNSLARAYAAGADALGEDWFPRAGADDCRVTWVDADGSVRYDSAANAEQMENHLSREEIARALAFGEGESERYSETLLEKTFYKAVRLANGGVVRVSQSQSSVIDMLLNLAGGVLLVSLFALPLAFFVARSLSRRITEPLNALNLDEPLKNDVYEELAPLLTRIERQQLEIEDKRAELARRREEFDIITGSMEEGLVFLNLDGEILSLNRAAERLFGANDAYLGQNMLVVDRSPGMQRLVAQALSGQRARDTLCLAGGQWQCEASPVASGPRVAGACLLFIEITQRAQLEQMRREFSANVTHELKTPLQTILGASELMENGMVKNEDAPGFVQRIHAEAQRLVALIDDILLLSRLDESAPFEREEVSLREIASQVQAALLETARQAHVELRVQADGPARIPAVKRLVYDIAYNLADNAIKYNRPGGSVCLRVEDAGARATLTVTDTGIGIPPENQPRVFERFYRVDKSHSRATGGTGLGLSIVKHAAQYLSADIALESQPGKGTRIEVAFLKELDTTRRSS